MTADDNTALPFGSAASPDGAGLVDNTALPFGSAASPGGARLVDNTALPFGSAASPGGARLVDRVFERLATTPLIPELAMLASGTGRVDRAVLRALRLLVPEADAATESDLWFSELVARHTANELVLRTDALDRLRARLARSPRLPDALAVIERVHTGAPPLLRLEDELIQLALRGAPAPEIEARLGAAFETLHQRAERSLDIATWALHALPRLPPSVRNTAAAWSLALAAESRAGYAVTLGGVPPPGVRLVEPTDRPLPRSPLGVWRRGRTVVLGDVAGPTLDVPATTPRVLRLAAGGWAQLVAIPAVGKSEPIDIPDFDSDLVVTDLTGRRWKIENQHRPKQAPYEPRGPRELAVQKAVEGLRAGKSFVIVGPPDVGMDWFTQTVAERLGVAPVAVSAHGAPSGDAPTIFYPLSPVDALVRLRQLRAHYRTETFLAALDPMPFPVEVLADALSASVLYFGDFTHDDIVDLCKGDVPRHAETILAGTGGHGRLTFDAVRSLIESPPSQAAPPLLNKYWHSSTALRSIRNISALLACARGQGVDERVPSDPAEWELWRAGFLERRRTTTRFGVPTISDNIQAIVPPKNDKWVMVSCAPAYAPSDLSSAEDLAARLAVSGWNVFVVDLSSPFIRQLTTTLALLRDDPVELRPQIPSIDLEIVVGGDRGQGLREGAHPLWRLSGDAVDAPPSAASEHELLERELYRLAGARHPDDLLRELGVLAGDGISIIGEGDQFVASNRLVPERSIRLSAAEADQLRRLGAGARRD